MSAKQTLNQYLDSWSGDDAGRGRIAAAILAIAKTGSTLSRSISRQGLDFATGSDWQYNDGAETENSLKLLATDLFESAMRQVPIPTLVSGDANEMLNLPDDGSLVIAIEPLDGDSSVETNLSPGTLFSILDTSQGGLLEKPLGSLQQAAGFLQYGPRTLLVLSCGSGTEIFVLDPITKLYIQTGFQHQISPGDREFSINTSNYRYWGHSLRYFVDDCISGADGPFAVDFDMRWTGSLVAESYRVLMRGGVFLAPGDSRSGCNQGQTRLLFEAAPLAMLMEQAGGTASDGSARILDLELSSLQQTVPLIFGVSNLVETVIDYVSGASAGNTHFPLFENRSLLRN